MIKWSWIGRIIKSIYDVIQQLISDPKSEILFFFCFRAFLSLYFTVSWTKRYVSQLLFLIWYIDIRLQARLRFEMLVNDFLDSISYLLIIFSRHFFLNLGEICTEEEVQHPSRKSHLGYKMYKNFHWLGQWHHDTERPRGPHQWQPPNECIQSQW